MLWKALIILGLSACVLGEPHAISEQKVIVRHKKISHDAHDIHGPHDKYEWSYPSYEFAYKVDDPHTGDKKGHEETREGDEVKGEYWLMQPDGRKRIVKYHADKKSGFKADVQYIGHAIHDKDHKKSHHIPHYPEVVHKAVKIDHHDHHKDYKVEEHGDYHHDGHGHSSQEIPNIDYAYRPISYMHSSFHP